MAFENKNVERTDEYDVVIFHDERLLQKAEVLREDIKNLTKGCQRKLIVELIVDTHQPGMLEMDTFNYVIDESTILLYFHDECYLQDDKNRAVVNSSLSDRLSHEDPKRRWTLIPIRTEGAKKLKQNAMTESLTGLTVTDSGHLVENSQKIFRKLLQQKLHFPSVLPKKKTNANDQSCQAKDVTDIVSSPCVSDSLADLPDLTPRNQNRDRLEGDSQGAYCGPGSQPSLSELSQALETTHLSKPCSERGGNRLSHSVSADGQGLGCREHWPKQEASQNHSSDQQQTQLQQQQPSSFQNLKDFWNQKGARPKTYHSSPTAATATGACGNLPRRKRQPHDTPPTRGTAFESGDSPTQSSPQALGPHSFTFGHPALASPTLYTQPKAVPTEVPLRDFFPVDESLPRNNLTVDSAENEELDDICRPDFHQAKQLPAAVARPLAQAAAHCDDGENAASTTRSQSDDSGDAARSRVHPAFDLPYDSETGDISLL